MNDKLKPCPFCGGEAIIDGCDDTPWSVICKKCAASVDFKETEREVIDAWNNRVEFNLSPKEIEALRKKFSSAIHDIPVSYYTEVRKPCIDERHNLRSRPMNSTQSAEMYATGRLNASCQKSNKALLISATPF